MTEQLDADVTDYLVKLTGPWMLNYGLSSDPLRIVTEMRGLTGGTRHKPAWRTADVMPDYPNAWNLGTARTTDGVFCEDFTPTGGKLWVQPGLAVSTSGTPGDALMSLTASLRADGAVVAAETLEIEPNLESGQAAYYPIGDIWPLSGCTHLLFCFIFTGVSGTIVCQPAWRSCNRFDAPSAWTDLGVASISVSANGPVNGGSLAISQPSPVEFYGQAGLKLTSTTARGTARVLVAGRFVGV
jgi:hypothetical protein